jgi:hypothetical protein
LTATPRGRLCGAAGARARPEALRERLLDEVVGAHFQAEQLVDLVILGGQEDHRQIGLLAQPAQQLHAIHHRPLRPRTSSSCDPVVEDDDLVGQTTRRWRPMPSTGCTPTCWST